MKILIGREREIAEHYLREASFVALNAKCLKHRRGAVIISNGEIIGKGWNSPPRDEPVPRCLKDDLPKDFGSDPTCCVHAEQNAYIDALRKNPSMVSGSSIYYSMIDETGKQMVSGKIYCTTCSKLGLEIGLKDFILLQKDGICSYPMEEFNRLSFGIYRN